MLGWLLLAFGAFQVAIGALIGGIWLVLIGWFLTASAASGYRHTLIRNALEGFSARDLMRTEFTTVSPELPVSRFIDEQLMQSAQLVWPVVDDRDYLVGCIGLEQVRPLRDSERNRLTVRDVMMAEPEIATIRPDRRAVSVLRDLDSREQPILVMADGRVQGLLSQAEFTKWLTLHQGA